MKFNITVKEFATMYGISHQAVYKKIKKKQLRTRTVRGIRMIHECHAKTEED